MTTVSDAYLTSMAGDAHFVTYYALNSEKLFDRTLLSRAEFLILARRYAQMLKTKHNVSKGTRGETRVVEASLSRSHDRSVVFLLELAVRRPDPDPPT